MSRCPHQFFSSSAVINRDTVHAQTNTHRSTDECIDARSCMLQHRSHKRCCDRRAVGSSRPWKVKSYHPLEGVEAVQTCWGSGGAPPGSRSTPWSAADQSIDREEKSGQLSAVTIPRVHGQCDASGNMRQTIGHRSRTLMSMSMSEMTKSLRLSSSCIRHCLVFL